jgi:hypothetical protein
LTRLKALLGFVLGNWGEKLTNHRGGDVFQ